MNEPVFLPRDDERRAERHVMVDLETIAQDAGGIFFAIAAVPFDIYTGAMGPAFFVLVDPLDAMHHGLKPEADAIKWWGNQAPEARAYLDAAYVDGLPLTEALSRLKAYLHSEVGPKETIRLWGKGGDFDKPFLDLAYSACDMEKPWGMRASRCYRSLEAFSPDKPPRHSLDGVAHHALDDTVHQVLQAIPALRHIYGLPALSAPIVQPPASVWVEDPVKAKAPVADLRTRRSRSP